MGVTVPMPEPIHRKGDDELVSGIVDATARGDWGTVADLADEAASRGLGSPAEYDEPDPDPSEISIGDEFNAVIVHPNNNDERDPVAKVNNTTTFVRFPGKRSGHVEFGESIRARLADKRPNHNLAVALEGYND